MIVRRLERRRKTMGMEDFFASLPTGKSDAPLLFGMGPLVYDFHDVDGLYYMLDHRLGGCLILMWSKPMNASVTGKVSVDEKYSFVNATDAGNVDFGCSSSRYRHRIREKL